MSDTIVENRVRELRARLRLRQSDLACEVGVTRQTIIAIEKGRLTPSVLVALKIARVLREPVDYVFYLETGREQTAPQEAEVPTTEALAKAAAAEIVEAPKVDEEDQEAPAAIADFRPVSGGSEDDEGTDSAETNAVVDFS